MGRLSRLSYVCIVTACAALVAGCSSDAGSGVITQTVDSSTSAASIVTSSAVSSVSSPPATSSAPPSSSVAASTAPPATTNPWPADLTPEQVTSAQAALASVNSYVQIVAEASANPPAKDWTADVRKYSADPEAAAAIENLTGLVNAGVHQTVPPIYENPTVISIDDHRAVVEDCVDNSTRTIIDLTGASVFRPPANLRTVVTVTLALYPAEQGGWLVIEKGEAKPVRTC